MIITAAVSPPLPIFLALLAKTLPAAFDGGRAEKWGAFLPLRRRGRRKEEVRPDTLPEQVEELDVVLSYNCFGPLLMFCLVLFRVQGKNQAESAVNDRGSNPSIYSLIFSFCTECLKNYTW